MKLILLSGGSGKRLWPLSNDARSKQFLKVLDNDHGEFESMVQRVWGQLRRLGLSDDSLIATGKTQVEILQSQLGEDVPLIIEPSRRDTFPAIALASTYLNSVLDVSSDEFIVVLPVDPYVDDVFFESLLKLEEVLNHSNADMALIGVKPTYPSEKYGYILPKNEYGSTGNYQYVAQFKEKPNEAQAAELIQSGALWNCGIFGFKLSYVLSILATQGISTDYHTCFEQYLTLPKISFDYKVVENASSIVLLQYDGDWKDLGTWNTLTEQMGAQVLGKGIITSDCRNTHLINELDIPITVIGISNAIIAASPDGIIISDKADSPKIKDIMKDIEQRPMFEERGWGSYKILNYSKYDNGNEAITRHLFIKSDKNLSYHFHKMRTEVWTILSGTGEIYIDDKHSYFKEGDVFHIPPLTKHAIKANTDLEIVEIQTGLEITEYDVHRITKSWGNIQSESLVLDSKSKVIG